MSHTSLPYNVLGYPYNSNNNKKEKLMSKEIKFLLVAYVLPAIALSLLFVFFAPAVFAQAILGMVCLMGATCIGMAFLIDYLDKKA